MPVEDYYQKYGPIHRRRSSGELATDQADSPLPRRRRTRRTVHRRTVLLRLIVGIALTFLVALLVLPYAVDLYYADQPLPGVTVQGLPVAGDDQQTISAALAARHAEFLREPLTLTYADQVWRPALAQLGVTFDPDEAAAMALEPGRRGDVFTRLREQWRLWRNGIDVSPRLIIDQQRLQDYLTSLSAPIEYAPRDATLSIAGGTVVGTPGIDGRQVLIDQSINDILLALQTLTPQQVTLRTRNLEPTVTSTALQAAEEQARALLSSPIVLTRGEQSWTWELAKLAEVLRVEPVNRSVVVTVNHESLTKAVEGLAQVVDSDSAEPRVRFENGTLRITQEGKQGWRLYQAEAVQAISATLHLSSPMTRTLALPVEELRPRVTQENLGTLGINELVSEGKSSFAGSAQYRITNIKAGAARTDGILIAPEEVFSFNTQLGEVNAENGFVEGYAVIGNRTQLEWGGGVCQNSTTVFRAAFWAGLPITERHAHPFYISWYDRFGFGDSGDGAGMDATIYTGVNDLKFVNDTGHWLLMQTDVDESNQILVVRLYGTQPARQVVLDGPYVSNEVSAPGEPVYLDDPGQPAGTVYQSDVARSGRDIVVYRAIVENGVEVRRDSFFTRFKAWPNVFVRGTG